MASIAIELGETDVHGGNIDDVRRRFPGAPEPWIDLSTGINPIPYPMLAPSIEAWSRLPLSTDERELRLVAAACYGAKDPASIVIGPGTQALIQVIPHLLPPVDVAVLGPTYGEHARAWQREGHQVTEIQSLQHVRGARVVVVVNPNNPTGRVVAVRELVATAEVVAAREGLLVVDEAFMDVVEAGDSLVGQLPFATVVLRSFGKAYGLAGIRLGFAISEQRIAARLRAMLGPWAVSGPALRVGRQALRDWAWMEDVRRRLAAEVPRLDALLLASGCSILGGTPLFRLMTHAAPQGVVRTLGRHGIHIRQFASNPTWLRIGIPGCAAAWRRLERALFLV